MRRLLTLLLAGLLLVPFPVQAKQFGKSRVLGTYTADTMVRCYTKTITALDSYTKLLVHGDGIADSTGKTVTANGNAAVTTTQYKFADPGRSIDFDGTTDYLSLADSADWDFGTGTWSIDFWVRFDTVASCTLVDNGGSLIGVKVTYLNSGAVTPSGKALKTFVVNTGFEIEWQPSSATWYHIEVTRSGDTLYQFISGTVGTTGDVTGKDVTSLLLGVTVGADNTTGLNCIDGQMAEVQISKGIARHTASFTPLTIPYDGARTVLNATGLTGDTDEEYRLNTKFENGSASTAYYRTRPNNDSGTNYGIQYFGASDTTLDAARSTGYTEFYTGYATTLKQSFGLLNIYAKTGFVRTATMEHTESVSGTTVTAVYLMGSSWNNTADNITSLVIDSSAKNGIGVGSLVEVYKKVPKQ